MTPRAHLPRSGSGRRRLTIAVAVMLAFGAACSDGRDGGDERASAPSSVTLGSAEAGDPAVPAAADVTVPEGPIGPPLAPSAPAADILAAVEDAHGPTRDATAQIRRFTDFPQLATPDGAELTELRADARNSVDGQTITVTSDLSLSARLGQDELTAFYRDQLVALGWAVTVDTAATGPGATAAVRRLAFQAPESPYPLDDLTIEVAPGPPLPAGPSGDQPPSSAARLHYVAQVPVAETTVLQRFQGWATGLPLPVGGTITGAGIQTSSEGRESLYYTLTVSYGSGSDPAALADAVRRSLPTPEFAVDPKPPTGDSLDNWVYLTSPFFADARLSPHQSAAGPILVNVNARVPFTPR